jgi:hypothetical protein
LFLSIESIFKATDRRDLQDIRWLLLPEPRLLRVECYGKKATFSNAQPVLVALLVCRRSRRCALTLYFFYESLRGWNMDSLVVRPHLMSAIVFDTTRGDLQLPFIEIKNIEIYRPGVAGWNVTGDYLKFVHFFPNLRSFKYVATQRAAHLRKNLRYEEQAHTNFGAHIPNAPLLKVRYFHSERGKLTIKLGVRRSQNLGIDCNRTKQSHAERVERYRRLNVNKRITAQLYIFLHQS